MTRDIIEQIKHRIRARSHEVIGCSEEEIENLMASQRVNRLPDFYHQLLLEVGQSWDWFFLGNDVCCWQLHTYKDEFLQDEIAQLGLLLPDDIFVFRSSQGVGWNFFRTKAGRHDTTIYSWVEFEPGFTKEAPSLETYITFVLDRSFRPQPSKEYFLYSAEQDDFYSLGIARF